MHQNVSKNIFPLDHQVHIAGSMSTTVMKWEVYSIFIAYDKSYMILPCKYFLGSNVSAKQVDATHYIRWHWAVEMCASEVPLQKVDYCGYISPAALGYYCLRYRL